MPITSIYLKEMLIGHVNMASCNCAIYPHLGKDLNDEILLYDPTKHTIYECNSGECKSKCCQPDCKKNWNHCSKGEDDCCISFLKKQSACNTCIKDSCPSPPAPQCVNEYKSCSDNNHCCTGCLCSGNQWGKQCYPIKDDTCSASAPTPAPTPVTQQCGLYPTARDNSKWTCSNYGSRNTNMDSREKECNLYYNKNSNTTCKTTSTKKNTYWPCTDSTECIHPSGPTPKPEPEPPIICNEKLLNNPKLYSDCKKIKTEDGFCNNTIKPNTVCFFWSEDQTQILCSAPHASTTGNYCPGTGGDLGKQVKCDCNKL